jgi:hypothetical protein
MGVETDDGDAIERAVAKTAAEREARFADYWKELGAFVHQFSYTERALQILLRLVAGVPTNIGQAAFQGYRVDAAKDAINRILEATNRHAAVRRLKGPLDHLGAINSMRNNIVHWGAAETGEDEFLISNSFLAHAPHRLREYTVSPSTLRQMTLDLSKISWHLEWEGRGLSVPRWLSRAVFRPILRASWQYRPPLPLPAEKAPRGGRPPKRRRPPAA